MTRLKHAALLLVATALGGTALAADVYRWIDEHGRTQISDVPPPKGAGTATKTPMPREDVTPERRRAAQERTARDQASLKRIEDERRRAGEQARKPAGTESPGQQDGPLAPRGSAEDCRNWRQEYANSQACFAPYRNATGGLKNEAFAACGPEVLDPSRDCGVPRN